MKYILLLMMLFSFSAKSQLIVSDPGNTLQNLLQHLTQLEELIEDYKRLQELVTQTELELRMFDEDGLWENNLNRLENILSHQLKNQFAMDERYGFTDFSLIPFIDGDSPAWRNLIDEILNNHYNILPEFEINPLIVDVYGPEVDPVVEQYIEHTQNIHDHSLDSLKYISDQRLETMNRKNQIEFINNSMAGLPDQSEQQILQIISTQMALMLQQQEALIQSLNQQIIAGQDETHQQISTTHNQLASLKALKEKLYRIQPKKSNKDNIDGF